MKAQLSKYHWYFALVFYLVISVLYFGQHVILHLNSRYVGHGSDPLVAIWAFGWYCHALLNHHSLFFTNAIFYPVGINLTRVNVTPGLCILFSPITYFFGPIVSYNICSIFSPGLAAWTGYVFFNKLSKNRIVSIFSGYIFGFSTYMVAQSLGHLCLVVPGILIPLFPLMIFLLLEEKINQYLFVILFTCTLIFLYMLEIEVFATFTFYGFISLFLAFLFFEEKRDFILKVSKLIFVSYLATIIFLAPIFFHFFFKDSSAPSIYTNPSSGWCNDFLSFFIPYQQVFMFSTNGTSHLSSLFLGNDAELDAYLGIPLCIFFFLIIKRGWRKKEIKYASILTLIFGVASLGPQLHVAGIKLLLLPWGWLMLKIPLISAALPCRLGLYMSFSLAATISIYLKNHKINKQYAILFVLSTIFLIPSVNRVPASSLYTPPFFKKDIYKQYIQKKDNLIILPSMLGQFWQVETNFYFNLAIGYLGSPPADYVSDPVFHAFENSRPSNNITEKNLAIFFAKNHIDKILIFDPTEYQQRKSGASLPITTDMMYYSPWSYLLVPLSYKVESVGGMTIYSINKNILKSTLL